MLRSRRGRCSGVRWRGGHGSPCLVTASGSGSAANCCCDLVVAA